MRIAVDVTNAGARAGEEVVQLYVRDVVASVTRPVQGAERLRAHRARRRARRRRVTFALAVSQLAFYDRAMRFVVEPGTIEVMVGGSSEDIRLTGSFEIIGETTVVGGPKQFTTRVLC